MASQNTTTSKRSTRTAGKITKKDGATGNGNTRADAGRTKTRSDMTLEELSLRAYKMTYKRLHGSKNTKK